MDLDVGIVVHGGEGHAVLQLISQHPPVHHVVAEGIEQFDVDVAHQGVQHFLERKGVTDKETAALCSRKRLLLPVNPDAPSTNEPPLVSIRRG